MTDLRVLATAIAAVATLGACSQENAPSEAIRDATDKVVEQAAGNQAPKLAKGPLAPRDDCGSIEGATQFRQTLSRAVKAKDVDALAALVAPDVKLDFAGGGGTPELRKRLAENDVLWAELAELVDLGCAASGEGGIVIPWLFEQDMGGRDPMMAMIVTGEDVPVHETIDPASPLTGTVSWDAVELVGGLMPGAALQHVKLANGKTGYIAADRLRSLLDYRLYASSRDGKWSITSFVAGD